MTLNLGQKAKGTKRKQSHFWYKREYGKIRVGRSILKMWKKKKRPLRGEIMMLIVMISRWELALFLFPIIFGSLQIFYISSGGKHVILDRLINRWVWLVHGQCWMFQPFPGFESPLHRRRFGPSQVLEPGTYKMRGLDEIAWVFLP